MMKLLTKLSARAGKRVGALLLCFAVLFGSLSFPLPKAQAVDWQTPYLNQLVSWDVMRGDQYGNLDPNRNITRSEFVTMLNRAFGYEQTGKQPFSDVRTSDWYYDDISIAYTAGYFKGTSGSTASPEATMTREEAATMVCRNLMLQPQAAEDLSFTDSRTASSWSRGYIKTAAEDGILRGYPDGSFRPTANITRGEVAAMLVRVIGTPIQTPGTYTDSVSGNLMVTSSGVTLQNLTVTGDLYITGGVGLGYVTLNNVTVYGKIVASGAGESNKGESSIILKNCTAPELIVDSASNQYVTLRMQGNTDINDVYVRTNTYIESKSTGRHGFQHITVDGKEGTRLDLAGNIRDVIAMTPKTAINIGSGTVQTLTIDEKAPDSTVNIAQGASVDTMNLDTATRVTGKGDIQVLNVNAPGCIVEMLPDIINIRPGITANINGIVMDSTMAEQMSDSPRILSGYPRMSDIAPNQAEATFQTNKPGTLYWAIRLSGDGAFSASDLIKPPTYGAKIVKSGNLSVKDAKTNLVQKINGLQLDTSYVLSAVLVDSRDKQSTVKSVYFTTPDNSKPAFASGYPVATIIEDTYIDFDVAPTKTCQLYWAIYKKGMPAPTANDFKSGTLSGAIDSGKLAVVRSEEDTIRMGNVEETAKNALAEMTEYDAYFFLTDTINDSTVTKVAVKTADRTPPVFRTNYPRISKIDAKALTGEAMINEDGKIYWAIVLHGADYPVANAALTDPEAIELDKKLQIKGGMYAVKSGSFTAKQDAAASVNLSGLEAETAYDIYFVAEDTSGNLSEIAALMNAKTLDQNAPKLLEPLLFSQANENNIPLADTDVTLVFNEDIYSTQTKLSLVEMYQSDKDSFLIAGSKDDKTVTWEEVIKGMFVLNNLDISDPDKSVPLTLGNLGRENITVSLNENGQTEVTFTKDALPLLSGTRYQFVLNYITDSSSNNMARNTLSPEFRVLDAQIDFNELAFYSGTVGGQNTKFDKTFSMIPYGESTKNASPTTCYDLLITADTTIVFTLYQRDHAEGIDAPWSKVSNKDFSITKSSSQQWVAVSLNRILGLEPDQYPTVPSIASKDYAIVIKSINNSTESDKWDATVNLQVFCVAGNAGNLYNFTNQTMDNTSWNNYVEQGRNLSVIGNPPSFKMQIIRSNQSAPQFAEGYPRIYPGDSVTRIDFQLDRQGELYYVVAPKGNLAPRDQNGNSLENSIINVGAIRDDGDAKTKLPGAARDHGITQPTVSDIMSNPGQYPTSLGYHHGTVSYTGSGLATFSVEGLSANAEYYIYFVLKGSYPTPSLVMCYSFSTDDAIPPTLTVNNSGPSQAAYSVSPGGGQSEVRANVYWALYPFYTGSGFPGSFSTKITLSGGQQVPVYEAMASGAFDTWTPDPNKPNEQNLKNNLFGILQGGGGNATPAPVQTGNSLDIPGDNKPYTIIDPELLNDNTYYILFVAAQNTLGGTPVFRTITNIQKVNLNGPRITSIETSYNLTNSKTVNGVVTIYFDENLFVLLQDDPTQTHFYQTSKDSWQPNSLYGTLEPPTLNQSARSYEQIKFKGFLPGDTILITPHFYSSDPLAATDTGTFVTRLGVGRKDPVLIRLVASQDDSGGTKYEFVIANGSEFDGLKSEIAAN